jgi:hypothetical protein
MNTNLMPAVVPLQLADGKINAGETTPVMLFPIGNWKTNAPARYPGGLPLTQDKADAMVANFAAGVLGSELQFSLTGVHLKDSVPSVAAFWVKRLYCAPYSWEGHSGDALWADARWTGAGADAVNDEQFKYVSIEAGPYITNDGDGYAWVLQGGVLTNKPLMRIMPPVGQAASAIAAAEIDLLELAEDDTATEDPVVSLVDKIDGLLGDLNTALAGKAGIGAIRSFMREVKAKAAAHKLAETDVDALLLAVWDSASQSDLPDSSFAVIEDGGTKDADGKTTPRSLRHFPIRDASGKPDAPHVRNALSRLPQSNLSPALMAKAKAAIDKAAASLGIGDSLKGADSMNEIASYLKLAEDAPESLILAEVKVRDAKIVDLETKLSERDIADRKATVETILTAAVEAREVKPGEREQLLKLAEEKPDAFDAFLAARKGVEVIKAGEIGDGGTSTETSEDPTVRLAEAASKLVKDRGIGYAEAMVIAAHDDAKLAESYLEV